jgi:hypothetical protein
VGDYDGLDSAGGGTAPGFKPFQVRANSGNLDNRTADVFASTASPAANRQRDSPAAERGGRAASAIEARRLRDCPSMWAVRSVKVVQAPLDGTADLRSA